MSNRLVSVLLSFSPSFVISFMLVFVFFFLSAPQLFIPVQTQQSLSFNLFSAPWNFLAFLFVHAGFAHLAGNVFLVFFLGSIVEKAVPKIHVYFLFFGVGVMSFALFNLASPGVFGFGASGGAIALTSAALVLSPKKSFIALLMVFLVSFAVVFAYGFVQKIDLQNLQFAELAAKSELGAAIGSGDPVLVQEKSRELESISGSIRSRELQLRHEREIQIGNAVHAVSAVLVIVYLFLFCRKETEKAVRETAAFFQGKHLKSF